MLTANRMIEFLRPRIPDILNQKTFFFSRIIEETVEIKILPTKQFTDSSFLKNLLEIIFTNRTFL